MRQDCELMCLNAIVFNKTGDEYWREARRFFENCTVLFETQKRMTNVTAFGAELGEILSKFDAEEALTTGKVKGSRVKSTSIAKVSANSAATAGGVVSTIETKVAEDVTASLGGRKKGVAVQLQATASTSSVVAVPGGGVAATPLFTAVERVAGGSRNKKGKLTEKKSVCEESGTSNVLLCTASAVEAAMGGTIAGARPPSSLSPAARQPVESLPSAVAELKAKDTEAGEEVQVIVLPKKLSPIPEAMSFIPCAVIQLKAVQAFFSCYQDCCFVCASPDSEDYFLFCVDCGEAFHSFCVDAPLAGMTAADRLAWRCINCKVWYIFVVLFICC